MNTCKNCKYWYPNTRGWTDLSYISSESCMHPRMNPYSDKSLVWFDIELETFGDFGCILYEPKDKTDV